MRHLPRRAPAALIALLAILLVNACVPTDRSVVTADTQVSVAGVVGEWKWDDVFVTIAKHEDGRSYAMTMKDDKGAQTGTGVLLVMKLGDDHFYEVETRNAGAPRASFTVGRLTIDADRLTGWTFEKDDTMLNHADVKTAEVADAGGGDGKDRVVAMEPAKVQAFLKAHAKEMKKEAMRVERVKPAAK